MTLDFTGFARLDRIALIALRDRLEDEIPRFKRLLTDVNKKLAKLEPDGDVLPRRPYKLSKAGRERISLANRLKNPRLSTEEKKRIKARLEELRPIVEAGRERQLSRKHRSGR